MLHGPRGSRNGPDEVFGRHRRKKHLGIERNPSPFGFLVDFGSELTRLPHCRVTHEFAMHPSSVFRSPQSGVPLISGQVFHLVSECRRAKFQNMNEREASLYRVACPSWGYVRGTAKSNCGPLLSKSGGQIWTSHPNSDVAELNTDSGLRSEE